MILFQLVAGLFILILVHELGHFLAAKMVGIEIEEFGIGFPPRIMELFEYKGTKFTLNWIPLGGFVRPKGENNPDIEGGLAAANPFARLFVLISGPAMNLAAGVIIFAVIISRIGAPILDQVKILTVSPDSPAESAGLLPEDVVVSINNVGIKSMELLVDQVQSNLDKEIDIIILRDDLELNFAATPSSLRDPKDGALGIEMSYPTVPIPTSEALIAGAGAVYENIKFIMSIPSRMINGTAQAEEVRLVGLKGMFDMIEVQNERDAVAPDNISGINTLSLFGAITVSLGLFNLFPIPPLDGGHILFLIPEIFFRKRVPQNFAKTVQLAGFAFFILVMIYVNVQDFINPAELP